MSKYETIIGLEIHLQLRTDSKMFCSCSNSGENEKPNTTICPICLGHPGTLPTVNSEAVKYGVQMALGLDAKINMESKFDRKNYFYPDLSKGYQISQFDIPLAHDGGLVIQVDGKEKRIGIERLHLEEDAAKNLHKKDKTLIDYNRAGTPLAEIVTKPDFRHPAEAKAFLQELRLIARYLKVSDADMEKGHLRCDANISLRPLNDTAFYPKTEIKNLNSFRAVERALEYEVDRQTELWNANKHPETTSTRGWDENMGETIEQRTKEGSADYRYFPEPDLPPLLITKDLLEQIASDMPELPHAYRHRLVEEYRLSLEDAAILVAKKKWAGYFENVMSELQAWLFKSTGLQLGDEKANRAWDGNKEKLSKAAFSWITGELWGILPADFQYEDLKISAENMAELVAMLQEKAINKTAAQKILKEMIKKGDDPSTLAEKMDLMQMDDDTEIEDFVIKVIASNPDQVRDYKDGKETLLKFFVGKVMAESKGKANPQKVEEILKDKLK